MRGVVEHNPASRARPPKARRESSHTPVFEEAEIVAFLDSINLESLKDIRDKAIFSVLFYSWCRVSALISLTVTDYYERGGTRWLRFQEKRGKEHEVPVHSKAKEAVDLWLERSCLASNPSAPLFPSFAKNRETIESRRLDRRSVLKLVEKRAKANGILKRVCCHSFRATGVLHSETGPSLAAQSTVVETMRREGTRQQFSMTERGGYLESVEEIPEPHSFVARAAHRKGRAFCRL